MVQRALVALLTALFFSAPAAADCFKRSGNGCGGTPTDGSVSGTKTECVMLNAAGIKCSTTGGCATATVEGTNFDYSTADFDNTSDEDASWVFDLPENLSGTTATWTAVWMSNNAACDGGATADVCWALDSGSFANDEAFNTGALGGTEDFETDRCLANGDIMFGPSGTITHGMTAGEHAAVVVRRDVGGTDCGAAGDDDLAADASLLAIRFCYEVDNVFSGE